MLKRVSGMPDETGACVAISEAEYPVPFASGLEYGAPARGTWNIVHTGMLIPESHQIFVCAANCLRGVVLTAAEMNAQDRFSTVTILEHNVLDGSMEDLIVEGVGDILKKLPKKPPAVLVYTSCIHHFMGCDLPLVYRRLREENPGVAFIDCYMTPILRKSVSPDQMMRKQLYGLFEPRPLEPGAVNLIGNNLPTDESSELCRMIRENGFTLRDITACKTYEEYQQMAGSFLNVSYLPPAKAGGEALEERLHQKHLYLPLCYGEAEIEANLKRLASALGLPAQDNEAQKRRASEELEKTKRLLEDTPIAIDYTATPRPLGLARLLVERGFAVERIYLDSISGEEKADFEWLRQNAPELLLFATVQVKMRMLPRQSEQKTLAIGQKAAYFLNTGYFVNMVEGGGHYGFDGIARIAQEMREAFLEEKDTRALIQVKGLGCGCCA